MSSIDDCEWSAIAAEIGPGPDRHRQPITRLVGDYAQREASWLAAKSQAYEREKAFAEVERHAEALLGALESLGEFRSTLGFRLGRRLEDVRPDQVERVCENEVQARVGAIGELRAEAAFQREAAHHGLMHSNNAHPARDALAFDLLRFWAAEVGPVRRSQNGPCVRFLRASMAAAGIESSGHHIPANLIRRYLEAQDEECGLFGA